MFVYTLHVSVQVCERTRRVGIDSGADRATGGTARQPYLPTLSPERADPVPSATSYLLNMTQLNLQNLSSR